MNRRSGWPAVARLRLWLAVGLTALAATWTGAATPADPARAARLGPVDQVTAAGLRRHLEVIASDTLGGRAPGSPGFEVAARYLAAMLHHAGAEPAGDAGTFLQRVPLRRTRLDLSRTVLTVGGRAFAAGEDFLAGAAGTAEGPMAFVGHGYRIPSRGLDPFAGLDVAGRLLVILPGPPPGLTGDMLAALQEGRDWTGPEANARLLGAIGILRVASARDRASWVHIAARRRAGAFIVDDGAEDASLPQATVDRRVLEALFDGEPVDAGAIAAMAGGEAPVAPFELSADKRVALTVANRSEPLDTWNVAAIVRGSDPIVASEVVAIGAHLDHVGAGDGEEPPSGDPGDGVYNGADDDGSGVAALLAMAEAVARGPRPRRSLLFVWHTAEEVGGLGARYFLANPPVPLDQIVAQLNVDMIGRSRSAADDDPRNAELTGPREIYLIGARRTSTELGEICEEVNRELHRLRLNYRYDDPADPSRMYERSDHYEYAQMGIPVAFFFSGLHADYHEPSDEIRAIDFDKLQRVAQTVLATAWRLANRSTRPAPDVPAR